MSSNETETNFKQLISTCKFRVQELVSNIHRGKQQSHPSSPSPPPSPGPSSTVNDFINPQPNELIGLGSFLNQNLPGCLDYICCVLPTAEKVWGPINHWAFSFKGRYRKGGQEGSNDYTVSKAWTLVELGQRAIMLMVHMMDGTDGHAINKYRWIWMKVLRLNRAI